MSLLQEKQPRDDYKELLELLLLFVGEIPPGGVKFRYPGTVSKVRFMMIGIYSLKMFLLRNHYPMTAAQKKGLMLLCVYVFKVHARAWFTASQVVSAPRNDFFSRTSFILSAR